MENRHLAATKKQTQQHNEDERRLNKSLTMASSPTRSRNGSSAGTSTGLLRNALSTILSPVVLLFRLLLTGRLTPGDEYDGLSAAVTAKASQQFVTYLRSFQNSLGNGNNNSTGNNASSSNGNDNDGSHQAWLTTGFAAAQEQATQQQSLLLVYLHSPLHRSAESFCKQVLCHDSVVAFISQPNITALGVSIHTAQGAYLAQLLGASCYPFLALLQPRVGAASSSNNNNNNGSMALVLRAEGPALTELSVQQVLPHFQTALQRHQSAVAEAEARRLQRQEESDLRRQQDEEYQATLLADQERERQKREEAEHEARRVQEEKDEEERQQAAAAAELEDARSNVPPEPTPGSGSVTTIRFVLPSGTKINRRFYSHETIRGILAYLYIYFHENSLEMSKNIGLSSNFPKKSYQGEPSLTLEEAGLAPQAVLMVQDLDA